MALKRVWTPSNNYSSGSTKRMLIIHSMEGFTGPNGAYDCAKYFQGDVGASSQVCIDNNRGTIWECVARQYGAWTQCGYNSVSVSVEQSGYASWSEDYWLSNRSNQLHNVADWLAEESAKFGIPLVKLNASQAQSNGKGIAYHSDLGSTGCGHSDPGPGWPLNQVIEWAKGGGSTPTPTEEMDMAATVAYYQGKAYFAFVGPDSILRVNGGIVDPANKCKSGAGIAIDPENGRKTVCYTNTGGKLCTYDQPPDSNDWNWMNRGWDSK
jgi:N-acetylmuramoyl-L-alanine amidase